MKNDLLIQVVATFISIGSVSAGGLMLPSILEEAEESTLRYTNNVVVGAPDWINTVGMSIGALRGLIVDYLWIKVQQMQQEGLFKEMKLRRHYEKPSVKKKRVASEVQRRKRKFQRRY